MNSRLVKSLWGISCNKNIKHPKYIEGINWNVLAFLVMALSKCQNQNLQEVLSSSKYFYLSLCFNFSFYFFPINFIPWSKKCTKIIMYKMFHLTRYSSGLKFKHFEEIFSADVLDVLFVKFPPEMHVPCFFPAKKVHLEMCHWWCDMLAAHDLLVSVKQPTYWHQSAAKFVASLNSVLDTVTNQITWHWSSWQISGSKTLDFFTNKKLWCQY